MVVTLDPLLKSILDAPVGQVENILKNSLDCDIQLEIVEQNQTSGSNFLRKIVITAKEFPLIRASTAFDSEIIPNNITSELLRKKDGIGTILSRNNITTERKVISLDFDPNGNKVTRNYQIINNKLVWFEIFEEIRLDYITACKNS